MTAKQKFIEEIPLLIPRSSITTEVNKTGSWRFVSPKYDEKTAPCSVACPAGEDIARIEMLANRRMFREAWETVMMENPLPAVCGRVCFHSCERACNRGQFDQPVAIHHLERFLGDLAISENYQMPVPERISEKSKKRIAIAGSGPAGLSAAYFLARLGYECDIFEAESEPGGVLRRGIPAYRLPEEVLKNEIARIRDMGCRLFCNTPVTQAFLKQAGDRYHALFMGCGYGSSLQMGIPGEQMANDGLAFLAQCRKGKASVCAGGTATVIGGGNTALDVVRSLVRMGSKPVLIYRRRREDMPAFAEEVEAALKEGVKIRELLAPLRMQVHGGDIVLFLQKMKPSGFDSEGRMRVVPDGANTVTLKVQQVFTAIGAEPGEDWYVPPKNDSSFPPPSFSTGSKRLDMSHCTLIRQYLPMIFGGDLTNPVKSVTDAIASGKQAAMALDIFFRDGWNAIEEKLAECRVGNGDSLSFEMYLKGNRKKRNPHIVSFKEINSDYFQPADRVTPPLLCPEDCLASFSEPEQTYLQASAVEESGRCFNCGICNDCDNCRLYCPEVSVFIENNRQINMDYCKGCGICVTECPRNAMGLE
ncbi:MAG: hypothetical protein BWK80_01760 [Desulfobacteraceae bacterium IS3]|nr:MAG: hypothetical protein BWK80_01760 [Desulfobacteraceae bacterium IS3]